MSQMKVSAKKSVALAGAMAMCAHRGTVGLGAQLGPLNTEHTLHSSNMQFKLDSALPVSWSCGSATFTADVGTPASSTFTITSASFTNCATTVAGLDCTVTMTAGRFPWLATALSLTNVTIDHVDVQTGLEATPSTPTGCALAGTSGTITGSLGGISWPSATHALELSNETGLSYDGAGTANVTVSGTVSDVAGSLTLS